MKTAFLTGATGFVGANLVRLLLERGYEVRALVRAGADRGSLPEHPGFRVVQGDLTDCQPWSKAVKGCDEVYHVAADYRLWSIDPRELYLSNVVGTENVLRAAAEAGARRIIHTSTVGTIGLANQPHPSDEASACAPDQFCSHYKRSKLEAEKIAIQYAQHGAPVVIVNPSTPIGPWDRKPTPTGKIIVDFVNGRIPAYVHTGLNFAHVKDVVEGHCLAASQGRIGERYILGGTNLSMKEFLQLVADQCRELGIGQAPKAAPSVRIPYCMAWLTGLMSTLYSDYIKKTPPAVPLEAVRMSKRTMYFDSQKAERELGLTPTPIHLAVGEALLWFSRNGYFLKPQSLETEKGGSYASPI